jgi:hypothetical protein
LAFVVPVTAQIELTGRVVNETEAPVAGARVTVRTGDTAAAVNFWLAQTEPNGTFKIILPAHGYYQVSVEREGYYELKNQPVEAAASRNITLVINTLREVFQSVDVKEAPSPVNIDQNQNQEHLTGTEVNDVPYASSHNLRSSITLLPGVVQDQVGGLHFNGSSENQILYLLNGFNVADPITGQFHTILGVEGVRSMDFSSGRYSPEFGKGSAGVLAIRTDSGSDAFHYTATDFFPGVNLNEGVRFGDWYPRVGVSGPIVAGRAWFADNFDSEYNQSVVPGLPTGQNTRTSWAGSNLLHTQVNITPTNILFGDFLFNIENQTHYGLAPLDPVSTTQRTRGREYFGSLKDQIYLGHGALVEFGYAHNYFADIEAPMGNGIYILTPEGRGGSYFVTSTQTAARDQFLADGYIPPFHFLGTHQIKAGFDGDHLSYSGNFLRTGYELIGLSGAVYRMVRLCARQLAIVQTAATGSGDPRGSGSEYSCLRVFAARGILLGAVRLGPHPSGGRLCDHLRRRESGDGGPVAGSIRDHHSLQPGRNRRWSAGPDHVRSRRASAATAARGELDRQRRSAAV